MATDLHYANFTQQNISIQGVWDDHDYGVNDGGKHVENRQARQDLFLQFLNVSKNNTARWNRNGVYSSHRYIQMDDHRNSIGTIDVIFLDTRSFRDDHWYV